MRRTDEVEDQALERLPALAEETVEQARRVRKEAGQAAGAVTQAHQHATSARVRAALAKRRELAAHARAINLHEQAAMLQERLGHPDRAATARAHADHARKLQALALQEQRDQERKPAGEWPAVTAWTRAAAWRSDEAVVCWPWCRWRPPVTSGVAGWVA